MNPVVELATQILPEIFPEARTYPYRIPENYQTLEELPIIKIEGVTQKNESYGSDSYGARTYHIQAMVFLDINETDIEEFSDRMDRSLEKNNYSLSYAEDHPHQIFENVQVIVRHYTTTKLEERGN